MDNLQGLRVIAAHAHPDDEVLWTGGAIAELRLAGAEVLVVTCTLGEQGETFGEQVTGLLADYSDQLGGFRLQELQNALQAVGVSGTVLGGVGTWRDSGMMGDHANQHERAFISSGPESVEAMKEMFREFRPHLVLTYGPDGGYGHPDHIRVHNIVHEAAQEVPVPRILWAVTSKQAIREAGEHYQAPDGWHKPGEIELESASVDSEFLDIELCLSQEAVERKIAGMKCHATQIQVADGSTSYVNPVPLQAEIDSDEVAAVYALTNQIALPVLYREYYQFGAGEPLPELHCEQTKLVPRPVYHDSLLAGLEWKKD